MSLPELKTPESSINEDPTIPIAIDPEDPTAPKVPSTALDENAARWRVGIFASPNYLLVSILVIVGLLCGGLLDITIAFGHLLGSQSSLNLGEVSLQSSSSSVAFGGTITLHGSNFTSYGQVGLTRDINIPIFDIQKRNIIRADAQGTFTDTINVEPAWLAGLHLISAEDALLHKTASFSEMVTGHNPLLSPPLLLLSTDAIDFGPGDQATNSTQPITLSNVGDGQIFWQSTVTQPWLMLSPTSGSFISGQNEQVTIAIDRANLRPGSYAAQVIFSSNAEQITLLVKMQITPLHPDQEAVLQLTSAVLSFTGADGGISPPGQVVIVNNPGVQPLEWSASSSTTDGSGWLSIFPKSDIAANNGSQLLTVTVDTSSLLPGVYTGEVTITSEGAAAVKDSPQTIYISLTVIPRCTLQVSPDSLTFTSLYQQPAPEPINISIDDSQGCSAPLNWIALSTTGNGIPWLHVGSAKGITPNSSLVSINTAGLTPATYTGVVFFSSAVWSQTLPVTFVLGQPLMSVMTVTPTGIVFTSIIGQGNPLPQTAIITNTGRNTLKWNIVTTSAPWLIVSPTSGIDRPGKKTQITFAADITGLAPGTHAASATITPSIGAPVTVNMTLTVLPPPPTPTPIPSPTVTPTPTATPTPTPTPTTTPTPTPTPTPTTTPTPTPTASASTVSPSTSHSALTPTATLKSRLNAASTSTSKFVPRPANSSKHPSTPQFPPEAVFRASSSLLRRRLL